MSEQVAVNPGNGSAGSDMRLTLIGPMPPPITGKSAVTHHIASEISPRFAEVRIADTSEGKSPKWVLPFVKLRRTASAMWAIRGSDAVYIAANTGQGMWLSAALAALARREGASLFLHHHSYSYVRKRKLRMVALTRAAGPAAHHILLSRIMVSDLLAVMPEIRRTLVVGNAGLVDRSLQDLPLKVDGGELVLGHLSNLCLDKGIAEVVDLAVALQQSGTRVRVIVGGPTVDARSQTHLDRAAAELGELFEYRGPLTGAAKRAFLKEITHFVFPSRYVHEAAPLVLFEAMAAGVVCVATRWGSIPEQLAGSPGVLAHNADSFVEEMLPMLVGTSVSASASHESREAYMRALSESENQLSGLVALMCTRQ
jgi:glycosyltransferase involved in cell wall biosynthesis